MTDTIEVAVTSDASGQLWSACMWDIHTGTQLKTYKGGGVCGGHTLSLVGTDYLVAGELSKPLLQVWPVHSSEPQQEFRTVCSGIVGALAVSPNGQYLVAGIAEKLHLWQVESGRLLAVAARHYQAVTCLAFVDDNSHFISAGDDGQVLVWSVNRLSEKSHENSEPVFIFQDHYLPVLGLHVGKGGMKARVLSVSLDGSCKVYDLFSGKLVLSLVIDVALTAVALNVVETSVFIGAHAGFILEVGLREAPRQQIHHLSEMEKKDVFKGHTGQVTSLSVSQDAVTLVSASKDETVRVWHIASRQCLRILQHKGPVTNMFITFIPAQIYTEKFKPRIQMHRLQRNNDASEDTQITVETMMSTHLSMADDLEDLDLFEVTEPPMPAIENKNTVSSSEVDVLKKANEQLFRFAVDKILKQAADVDYSENPVPSLVNIDLALEQINDKDMTIQPVFELKSKKKRSKKARRALMNGRK